MQKRGAGKWPHALICKNYYLCDSEYDPERERRVSINVTDILTKETNNSSTTSGDNKTNNNQSSSNSNNNNIDPVIIVNILDQWAEQDHKKFNIAVKYPTYKYQTSFSNIILIFISIDLKWQLWFWGKD